MNSGLEGVTFIGAHRILDLMEGHGPAGQD
jgi:hypothetical protein